MKSESSALLIATERKESIYTHKKAPQAPSTRNKTRSGLRILPYNLHVIERICKNSVKTLSVACHMTHSMASL